MVVDPNIDPPSELLMRKENIGSLMSRFMVSFFKSKTLIIFNCQDVFKKFNIQNEKSCIFCFLNLKQSLFACFHLKEFCLSC